MIAFGILILIIGLILSLFLTYNDDISSAIITVLASAFLSGFLIGLELEKKNHEPTIKDYLNDKVDITYKYELQDSVYVITDTIIKFKQPFSAVE